MHKLLLRFPAVSRFILAVLLGVAAIISSGIINNWLHIKKNLPPTDVILLILATWVLYRTDKKSLNNIGLNLQLRNLRFLLFGFLIGAIALICFNYISTAIQGGKILFNNNTDYPKLWQSLYLVLPSCIVQELMFRGYCFTKTIELAGVTVANIIFSILFMLVHVIDRDVLQNLSQVIALAVIIPVDHLWFAAALLRSKTLYFPIGLHWGNNWVSLFVLTQAKTATSVLYKDHTTQYQSWTSFIAGLILFNGFYLLITWLIWKWPKRKTGNDKVMCEPA